jgi:hypothetical protein
MATPSIPLVPSQFNMIMQAATLQMLGITITPSAYATVRVDWQTDGQPFTPDPQTDVTFIRMVEEENLYNKQRDREFLLFNGQPVSEDLYTRVWRVYWVIYGPNSFDNARKIRSGLFSDPIHNSLSGSNVYFVTNPSAPLRVPEVINGRWYDRSDFSALFNEFVTEAQLPVGVATSLQVAIYSQLSPNIQTPLATVTIT